MLSAKTQILITKPRYGTWSINKINRHLNILENYKTFIYHNDMYKYLKNWKEQCVLVGVLSNNALIKMVFISKKFFFVTNLLLPMLQLFHLLLVIQHHQQKSKREKIFMKLFFLVLKNLKQFKYYLFLNHSKFLIHRLEVESVESRSIKENFEISESDFSNLLTDAWHERSDWTVGKVQNLGGSGWSCWSWNKNQSWFEDNLAIFMIWHEMMIS